ncbi:MAG TPA: hypothetical protein VMV40_06910 [Acidiferrobacter sp.]|nr:hypothetical protein [Acidiferrobacter sp.]
MRHFLLSVIGYRAWVLGLVLVVGPVGAACATVSYDQTVFSGTSSVFAQPRQPLVEALNPHGQFSRTLDSGPPGLWDSLSQTFVLRPGLGTCQSFVDGCREGAIVTIPTNNVIETMGVGLGVQMGAVRFEYARGLHSGVDYVGIRSPIP